ncbi:MAG: transcriptional antiterminator [Firmicutes bacterium]|nr:transcriptional antiterminator [Bacillota bacterium]
MHYRSVLFEKGKRNTFAEFTQRKLIYYNMEFDIKYLQCLERVGGRRKGGGYLRRMEIVYRKLKELNKTHDGISAIEIAEALGLSRANVSNDLNRLCEGNRASKTKGKPVRYFAIEVEEIKPEFTLDKFTSKNQSLFPPVEQAKAAILYPPNGMNMLILGETGVGKSMFVGLLHRYAIEIGKMDENAPFITFNCADYANNPQLLLGQLFGTKKGAFTGADADKAGLVEKANGGILFLDEVHRLPPEGQEMFFTFMDHGVYRRLGETEAERAANVLILAATTENPESLLLKTFTRRIPMVIRIPTLAERSLEERFYLISQFLREEAARLGNKIKVSVNTMRAFISYHCPNNVGQLRTDIQLACAKAYADFISHNKEEIKISSMDIQPYIRQGLYLETEHRQLWNKLVGINTRYCIFDKGEEQLLYEEDQENESIYEMINLRFHELKGQGVASDKLEQEMEKDISEYFKKYIHSVSRTNNPINLAGVIEENVVRVIDEVVAFCEASLDITLSRKVYYGMAVHIANSIERIRKNKKIIHPQLNRIRTKYPDTFNTALDCLKIMDKALDISMPIDEAAFLTLFLVFDDRKTEEKDSDVRIIVVAHGASTATSMADAANSLLGVNHAVGINAPLEEKPQKVIATIKNYLREAKITSDVLFLVDMGSLTNFGQEIEEELAIHTKTLPLVSTLHVIEATRKAVMGYSINEVFQETLRVNSLVGYDSLEEFPEETAKNKLAIVTVCTTGEGGAVVLRRILTKHLNFDRNIVEIFPVSFNNQEDMQKKLKAIEKEYIIACIISPFRLTTAVHQYDLEDVLSLTAMEAIQRTIDVETTYIKMGETLENQLKHIRGKEALTEIKKFNSTIEESLNKKFETNVLIGITFHMACMIDRLKDEETINAFEGKEPFIAENRDLYRVVKNACAMLNTKYAINIVEDEICYIMRFFKHQIEQ